VSRLVAGELIKVRTTRTALGFAAAALLFVLLMVFISILAGDPKTIPNKQDSLNFGNITSFVLMLLGAVGATGEFRHRTLAPAVLIAPDRLRLFLARTIAYAATALAVGIVLGIISFAIGIPLLGGTDGPDLTGGDLTKIAVGGLIEIPLYTAIGVGFGTLVRNQVFAVVSLLVWVSIGEPLLGLLGNNVDNYLIGSTMSRIGAGGDDQVGFGAAILVAVAWTVVVCAIGAIVDRRRDVE
jgi:ABC-2 type transport system permease protein